jgi:hypothetical protein
MAGGLKGISRGQNHGSVHSLPGRFLWQSMDLEDEQLTVPSFWGHRNRSAFGSIV